MVKPVLNIHCLTIGLIIGIVVATGIANHRFKNYHEIYEVNIGKFTFISGKIYSLTEMERDSGVRLPITK